jgi:catechol 2,3-dioxygenase-like lactoylglutathione lyase family enzyme
MMFDHVSIGVADVAAAKRFYDAALKPLGYRCLSDGAESLGYGRDSVALWILASSSPVRASDKSGLHFCFAAPTPASVDEFYAAALAAGGRDNGRPGIRADYASDYYAAFVTDPAGYRIEALRAQLRMRAILRDFWRAGVVLPVTGGTWLSLTSMAGGTWGLR